MKAMKINEQLKENLIVDVENILEIEINEDDKKALKRAFEITIGIEKLTE